MKETRHKKSNGFTIIELLVVVVVVAIIGVATFVTYSDTRVRAIDASMSLDVSNATRILANDLTLNGRYPATLGAANNGRGIPTSSGNSFTYTVNNDSVPPTYILTVSNALSPNSYAVSNNNNIPTLAVFIPPNTPPAAPPAENPGGSGTPVDRVGEAEDIGGGGDSAAEGSYVNYSRNIIASTSGIKILFFHAPWSPQCMQLEESILKDGLPTGVTVIKVDYDSNPELREQYGVALQSTFVRVGDRGEEISSYVANDRPQFSSVERALLR